MDRHLRRALQAREALILTVLPNPARTEVRSGQLLTSKHDAVNS